MFPQSAFGEPQPQPVVPRLHGAFLAQVIGVSADDHTVEVLFPAMTAMIGSGSSQGCKAHVLERRASQLVGDVDMPRLGDWGLVVFPGGSTQLAVWLGSLYKSLANICTEATNTHLTQYEDGSWFRVKADGTVEFSHPSGTYMRLGSGTALGSRTRRERQGGTSRTVTHQPPANPAVTVHLEHSSGAKVTIMPSGEITIASAAGQLLHLAGTAGEDFIALKAGLEKLLADLTAHISWAQTHVHSGVQGGPSNSGAPSVAPAPATPLVAETHYTGQAKAT
jgi:hypothetical protein